MARGMTRGVTKGEAGALAAGVAGSALLTLTLTGTMSAFTASISTTNSAASSSPWMEMQETNPDFQPREGVAPCRAWVGRPTQHSAACSLNILRDTHGKTIEPGYTHTSYYTVTNVGQTTANTFDLTFSPCTSTTAAGQPITGAPSVCNALQARVAVKQYTIFVRDLTALNTQSFPFAGPTVESPTFPDGIRPGEKADIVITVEFPAEGSNQTTYVEQEATTLTTWRFQS